jgi:hypothetical protein
VAYDAAGPTRHATLSQQQKEKSRHASHRLPIEPPHWNWLCRFCNVK